MAFDTLAMDPDQDSALIRLAHLGRHVTSENSTHFKEMVCRLSPSGLIDITGWTRDAIYVLLCYLREVARSVTLRNGSRYFTPILFPEGPLLQSLVDAIATGQL